MKQTKGAIGNLLNRYRAVLKKCHLLNTFGSLAVASMLVMGGVGVAQAADPVDVALGGEGTYTGEPAEVDHLMGGWLYVGGEESAQPNDKTPVPGQDISLDVKGGAIEEIIGGSYVKVSSDGKSNFESATTIELGDIKTTIGSDDQGGGTTSEFVVGGSKIANDTTASLKTGDIELVIKSGTFGNNGNTEGYELVVGGNYIKGMKDYVKPEKPISSIAGNVTVRVEDGTFHASVIGGSVAQSYGATDGLGTLSVVDDSTSVVINGGTFNPSASINANGFTLHPAVVGGAMAYGANSSTIVNGNSSVVINGDEDTAPTIAGKVVAGSVVAEGALSAENKGATTLTMNGGTVNDDLVGGGFVQDAASREEGSYNLTGTTSSVAVNGGTAMGEIIGGAYVRGNGSSILEKSSVTISGGTFVEANASANKAQYIVGGSKAMAYGDDKATVTTTGLSEVIVDGEDVNISDGAVVGGSVSKATGTGSATSEVASSRVTVNKGTLAGVIGGSLSETYSGGTSNSEVGEGSAVVINGGIINNVEYGAVAGNAGMLDASVVGGSVANGTNTTATVASTDVRILAGTISDKVVAGSAAGHNGSVTVKGDTNLVMTAGTAGDLVGGNLVDGGTSGKESNVEGSTFITFSGGTVEGDIMGGSYVRNAAATSTVKVDTHVTVSGTVAQSQTQKWVENVFGGGKAMTNTGGQTATANVDGTAYVTVRGDANIQVGLVAGGGMSRLQETGGNATATVNKAVVTVEGGTLAGVAGGGIAENRTGSGNTNTSSATVGESELNITGGIINAAKYGNINREETTVGIAVIGGGIAWSGDSSTQASAQSTVEHAVTNISGNATVEGDVVAAGLAHGKGTSLGGTTDTPTTAELNMNGGTVKGDVFAGGAAIASGKAEYMNVTAAINAGTVTGNVYAGNYTGEDSQVAATGSDIAVEIGSNAVVQGYVKALTEGTEILIREGASINTNALEDETITDAGVQIASTAINSTVLLDGNNAADAETVANGFKSEATGSTLAFNNYTTSFNNVATGFDTVEAYAGSTVTVGHLSTGTETAGQEGFFDVSNVAGEGEIIASNVGVTSELGVTGNLTVAGENSSISVTDGGKVAIGDGGKVDVTKANSITTEDQADIAVNAGGTFDIAANQITKESKGATLASGGTVNVIGDSETDSIKASDLASKFGTSDQIAGIVNVEGVEVTNLFNTDPTGDRIEASNVTVMGIATEQTKSSVLTGVDNADNKAAGAWKAVELAASVTDGTLVADRDLQLIGSPENSDYLLVSTKDGQKGNLRIGASGGSPSDTTVILGHEGQNNKGTLGDVIMSYTDSSAEAADLTLKVVGDGNALFQVDNINGGNISNKTIDVKGATLKTLNISGPMDESQNYDAIQTVKITKGGSIEATGVANVVDVTLAENSSFTAAKDANEEGGNITIKGDLSGVGTVDAANKLDFAHEDGLTTEIDDVLVLRGTEVAFTSLNSTNGQISIEAGTLTTTGEANVKGDTIKADRWNLGDAFTADGNSVLQAGQFGTTDGTSTLTQNVTLNDTSLLVHGDTTPETLAQAQAADVNHTGATYYSNKNLAFDTDGALHVNAETGATDTVVFGSGSMLVVDSNVFGSGDTAVYTGTGSETASVADNSWFYAVNAQYGDTITVFEKFGTSATWDKNYIHTDTPMLEGSYNDNGDIVFNVQDPVEQFPGLSGDLAPAVYDLYVNRLNDVNDPAALGVRFLSRATNDAYLGRTDRRAAASTIESAARMAFAGAVPQMTKMASDSATNSVVNRMGFANPENGAKAMNVDGRLVDDKALGLALWIAPLWSNQTGFGMEAGNLDYGYNANIGGISLGADYTWANNFRAGLMFNIGGGYAESSGDLSETTNSMTFWGIGAYGGWKYENFAVMGDVSYTSTWNSVDQDLDHRMGMGDLESDIQASAISAGLRFEYKLETQYLDLIPHVGARYMSINTWGYDVDSADGTILEGDGFQQNIWTFPVGITFSKELEMNNDWYFKPSVDFTVIPAAGDIKAKEDVLFTGMQRSYEVETQMMDYFTWQGGVGLEFGNDNMSVGVNYTLQAGQNSTGHGVFGMFRYEF